MEFTQIGPNKVRSDKGFVFWMKSPFQLHYSEGEREVVVTGEMLTGESELLVSVSAIRNWVKPHNAEAITSTKRDQIALNIGAALAHMGVRYAFD